MQKHWMIVGLIALLALGLNLWNLGQPPRLVSDEWYFVQDAQRYRIDRVYTDVHPPLGKLQIAFAIELLGNQPTAWRAINAFFGALLILTIAWIGWEVSRRPRVVIFSALGVLLSGFLLTESRIALINLPYVLYGFAAIGCVFVARRSPRPVRWLALAGVAIGLAVSVKWLAILLIVPGLVLWFWPSVVGLEEPKGRRAHPMDTGWLLILPMALFFGIYAIHFFLLGTPQNTWQTLIHNLDHHLGAHKGHPYRDMWWRWPLLWQPFPYWSQLHGQQLGVIWSMPNPLLWWLGWIGLGWSIIKYRMQPTYRFVIIGALMSWLPLALIQRDMFLYHAFPFCVWIVLLLALLADQFWEQRRVAVITVGAAIFASYISFLPWWLNWPLSETQHNLRRWLPTWTIGESELKAIQGGDVGRPPPVNRPQ